jgi:hypothetical protein
MFDPRISAGALNWKRSSNAYATSDEFIFIFINQWFIARATPALSACAQDFRGLFYLLRIRQDFVGAP